MKLKLSLSLVAILPHLTLAFSSTASAPSSTTLESVNAVSSVGSNRDKITTTRIWRGPWGERFQDLLDFQQEHGHCRVPKRYDANKSLANWVSKQRQEHRKFINGEKASITADRIEALEEIGFCWNAQINSPVCSPSNSKISSQDDTADEEWHERLQSLVDFMSENKLSSVSELPLHSSHDIWLKKQRQWIRDDQNQNTLVPSKGELLDQVDPLWHLNRHELLWETRYQELVAYAKQHGDCCVPISYSNKKLANWVSNQRKLYCDQLKGRRNSLTDQRKQRLGKIGFIWNRWDYEFDRKNVKEGSFLKP
mmetsp:Transcript_1374/g.2772  ORF Transcript_1374/g.2772 Transcript_1374/m.2772 type:complete len:309 (-) Transcript_1374:2122-3048(-)|eukprot:scaffold7349_cov173-Amphora_coffeaeformis.AAC.20